MLKCLQIEGTYLTATGNIIMHVLCVGIPYSVKKAYYDLFGHLFLQHQVTTRYSAFVCMCKVCLHTVLLKCNVSLTYMCRL